MITGVYHHSWLVVYLPTYLNGERRAPRRTRIKRLIELTFSGDPERQSPLKVSPPAAAGYGSLSLNVTLQWQTVRAAYGASGQKELSLADFRSQFCSGGFL